MKVLAESKQEFVNYTSWQKRKHNNPFLNDIPNNANLRLHFARTELPLMPEIHPLSMKKRELVTGADLGGGAEGAAAPPFSSSEIYFLSKYTIIL